VEKKPRLQPVNLTNQHWDYNVLQRRLSGGTSIFRRSRENNKINKKLRKGARKILIRRKLMRAWSKSRRVKRVGQWGKRREQRKVRGVASSHCMKKKCRGGRRRGCLPRKVDREFSDIRCSCSTNLRAGRAMRLIIIFTESAGPQDEQGKGRKEKKKCAPGELTSWSRG